MNRPIRNLAIACLVLFLSLMVNATYLQFFAVDDLSSLVKHPDNSRVSIAAFSSPRGDILVNGRAIAHSVPSKDRYKYLREYPENSMYAHIVGYFGRYPVGGLEASENSVLTGQSPELFANRVSNVLSNTPPAGGNVSLTLNAKAQQAAYLGLKALGNNIQGAVVAIEPSTGKILAMVSSPTFDPNKIASHDFTAANAYYSRMLNNKTLIPLDNRAIENPLPPGSTFKLITAAAALSSGRYHPDSLVPGGAVLNVPQTTADIHNESRGSCGAAKIRALDVSCNVAFGAVGLDLGANALLAQAEKFGFNQTTSYFTDLDDPLTSTNTSVFPKGINIPQTAQSAIGQYEVSATPLQMAMVASAIANNGTLMKPYLVSEFRSADLDVIKPFNPQVFSHPISAAVASDLAGMMVDVVNNGTGRSAQIPGIAVAGKTGTAQSSPSRPPYAWFVSFAPALNAKVAVAVLIQDAGVARNQISGAGLAAPIAKRVMEAVLNQ
jgi:peptidoglycan glycosyltransferase